MKNSAEIVEYSEKKFTIADVFANQHPVINGWIMLSAIGVIMLLKLLQKDVQKLEH